MMEKRIEPVNRRLLAFVEQLERGRRATDGQMPAYILKILEMAEGLRAVACLDCRDRGEGEEWCSICEPTYGLIECPECPRKTSSDSMHYPTPYCESGKKPHCTCDRCY